MHHLGLYIMASPASGAFERLKLALAECLDSFAVFNHRPTVHPQRPNVFKRRTPSHPPASINSRGRICGFVPNHALTMSKLAISTFVRFKLGMLLFQLPSYRLLDFKDPRAEHEYPLGGA